MACSAEVAFGYEGWMLVVESVEERQLLMAVTGVVGRINVQDNLFGFLTPEEADVMPHEEPVELGDLPRAYPVLEATQGRLGSQRILIRASACHELQRGPPQADSRP
jgi:hypothetical protein